MIGDSLAAVRARIDEAARRAGRDPRDIALIVVTKDVDVQAAREAVANGVTDIGENRVQELQKKHAALAGLDVRWHMIGTLQRNKVRQVVGRVSLIHSVDSEKLAHEIGLRAEAEGIAQDVLLEVNAGGEASKHGVAPAAAVEAARGLLGIDGLRVRGFMTVAPQEPEAARRSFRMLREVRDTLQEPDVSELSMGMTDDFEIAIEEGATIVRIGTAIFGARSGGKDAKKKGFGK